MMLSPQNGSESSKGKTMPTNNPSLAILVTRGFWDLRSSSTLRSSPLTSLPLFLRLLINVFNLAPLIADVDSTRYSIFSVFS